MHADLHLGIMRLRGGMLVIDDIAKLCLTAGFDDQYLQRKLKGTA